MDDQRRFTRTMPLPELSSLTMHWICHHVFGWTTDESPCGLGIRIAHPAPLCVGQPLVIHRFHENRLRFAQVRHTTPLKDSGAQIGVQWVERPWAMAQD
jgi:hypothetical protein